MSFWIGLLIVVAADIAILFGIWKGLTLFLEWRIVRDENRKPRRHRPF